MAPKTLKEFSILTTSETEKLLQRKKSVFEVRKPSKSIITMSGSVRSRAGSDSVFIDSGWLRPIPWVCWYRIPIGSSTEISDRFLTVFTRNFVGMQRNRLPKRYPESGDQEIVGIETEPTGHKWPGRHFSVLEVDTIGNYLRVFFHSKTFLADFSGS